MAGKNDNLSTTIASNSGQSESRVMENRVYVHLRGGDFDSATVVVQRKDGGDNWAAISGASYTVDTDQTINLPLETATEIRFSWSGGMGSVSITAELIR